MEGAVRLLPIRIVLEFFGIERARRAVEPVMRHQQRFLPGLGRVLHGLAKCEAFDPAARLGQLLELVLADRLHVEAALLHADDELLRGQAVERLAERGLPDIVVLHQEA